MTMDALDQRTGRRQTRERARRTRRTLPRIAATCVIRPLENGFLVYNKRTDELHLMTEGAFEVYRMCDGARYPREIVDEVCGACGGADPAVARRRAYAFLGQLTERGLVESD
jgi:hypothetical protein